MDPVFLPPGWNPLRRQGNHHRHPLSFGKPRSQMMRGAKGVKVAVNPSVNGGSHVGVEPKIRIFTPQIIHLS